MLINQLIMLSITVIFASTFVACSLLDYPIVEYAEISETVGSNDPLHATPMLITGSQALEMASGDVIIVDVRNLDEFNAGHVEHAILLPVDEIAARAATVIPDKSQTIILYCRSGARSSRAATMLSEMGYTSVYDFGAFTNWAGTIVIP